MSTLKQPTGPRPPLREQRLCCLVNTVFKCKLCQARVCNDCNSLDIDEHETEGRETGNLGYTGHLLGVGEKCHALDINAANLNWDAVELRERS
jgi:hypothetical protein